MMRFDRIAAHAPATVGMALALSLLVLAPLASPRSMAAQAQGGDPRAELTRLYRLAISNDLCDFPLSEAQSDALAEQRERLESTLDLSDSAADQLYEQVETQMRRQQEAGLCNPNGEWAKVFARDVAELLR